MASVSWHVNSSNQPVNNHSDILNWSSLVAYNQTLLPYIHHYHHPIIQPSHSDTVTSNRLRTSIRLSWIRLVHVLFRVHLGTLDAATHRVFCALVLEWHGELESMNLEDALIHANPITLSPMRLQQIISHEGIKEYCRSWRCMEQVLIESQSGSGSVSVELIQTHECVIETEWMSYSIKTNEGIFSWLISHSWIEVCQYILSVPTSIFTSIK